MLEQVPSEPQLQEIICGLVDQWCQRRALGPLRILLPAWPLPLGLTDDWHHLQEALRHVRAMAKDSLTEAEREQVNTAIAIVDRTLYGR